MKATLIAVRVALAPHSFRSGVRFSVGQIRIMSGSDMDFDTLQLVEKWSIWLLQVIESSFFRIFATRRSAVRSRSAPPKKIKRLA
jgi:hypothetical protein